MDKPKILIVDDETDVVDFVENTLRAEGFEVISAYDGIGALDIVATEKPDLVLLDIMMPMMSGYEVCEQIRANPDTRHIPVICVSSSHAPDARPKSIQSGASALIVKPFLPKDLVAEIRHYLKQEKEPAENNG